MSAIEKCPRSRFALYIEKADQLTTINFVCLHETAADEVGNWQHAQLCEVAISAYVNDVIIWAAIEALS